MTKQELKAEIIRTFAAIQSMENNRTCWEMGDEDNYERLCAKLKKLNSEYEN